jgi:hypothetical protein
MMPHQTVEPQRRSSNVQSASAKVWTPSCVMMIGLARAPRGRGLLRACGWDPPTYRARQAATTKATAAGRTDATRGGPREATAQTGPIYSVLITLTAARGAATTWPPS